MFWQYLLDPDSERNRIFLGKLQKYKLELECQKQIYESLLINKNVLVGHIDNNMIEKQMISKRNFEEFEQNNKEEAEDKNILHNQSQNSIKSNNDNMKEGLNNKTEINGRDMDVHLLKPGIKFIGVFDEIPSNNNKNLYRILSYYTLSSYEMLQNGFPSKQSNPFYLGTNRNKISKSVFSSIIYSIYHLK